MTDELNEVKTEVYVFGEFRLIPSERLLFCGVESLSLSPKVFDVLVLLVENNGHLVNKDELLDNIWADSFIEEATLTRTISRLRKILGENSNNKYIQTVPTKGYRFASKVKHFNADDKVFENGNVVIENDKTSSANTAILDSDKLRSEKTSHLFTGFRLTLALGTITILIFVTAFIWESKVRNVNKVSAVRSIAVLPFKMIGKTENDKALRLGMADALIIKFSNLDQLVVRPTSAVFTYEGQEFDSAKVGRELQVDAVLEGIIQKNGDNLRVTIQLLSSADGTSLWAEKFNAHNMDIFEMQDNISTQVTKALELKLTETEQEKLTKHFTENRKAYDAYITGRYLWNRRTNEDLKRSLEFFEKAIKIDSNYALAYTGLADCYQLFAEYRILPTNEAFAKARTYAKKALEIDKTLSEAHTSYAYTLAFYDWNFDEAEKEFKQALELNPNYATAHMWYSEYFQVIGKFNESWDEIKKAQKITPQSQTVESNILALHYLERDFDLLLSKAKQLVEREPEFSYGHIYLFYGYERTGKKKDAVEVYLKGVQNYYGSNSKDVNELRNSYQKTGWKGFWKKRIEQMENEKDSNKYLAWDYLFCHIRAENREESIKAFEQSYKNRDRWIVAFKYDPSFDLIRSDPRIRKLAEQIGTKQEEEIFNLNFN